MATEREAGEEAGPGTERLQAFSDGVFAVAITLLIFNVSVSPGTRHLPEDLLKIWPQYVSYVFTFMVLGIVWAQHHALFSIIKRTDHVFLLINVVFLMWIVFLPFPTHVLGDQLGKHNEQAAMSFYTGTWVVGTIPFNLVWRYASHGRRLLAADASLHLAQVINRSYLLGLVFYAVDFALSFVSVTASLVVFVLLAVYYAVIPIPAIGGSRLLRPLTGVGGDEG